MKKLIIFAFATCMLVTSSSFADIQSPPGGKQNRIRKLSRAVGNIVYGMNEVPVTWARTVKEEGSVVGASYGLINGTYRSVIRAGYGVYEFVTFPFATYKGSYRPDYRGFKQGERFYDGGGRNIWWDLNHGYAELVPELGFQSKFGTGRSQKW